ncbi:MAG: hypothetical protein ACREX3_00360 [Gammaproteobacteria bacterium]
MTEIKTEYALRVLMAGAIGLCLCFAAPIQSPAQAIRVAVDINDSTAKRVFQGAFTSAFRSLGDVAVVSTSERPDYVLEGVVICDPSCDQPITYAAALRFWSPLSEYTAQRIAMRIVPQSPAISREQRADSVGREVVWPILRRFEETHRTWVVNWGRERYEQAAREFVRRIDVDCFERARAIERAMATPDSSRLTAIMDIINKRSWMC